MLFVSLNRLHDMDTEAIVIRIKTPSGDMDSSVDCPSLLNFNDLLVSALPDPRRLRSLAWSLGTLGSARLRVFLFLKVSAKTAQ